MHALEKDMATHSSILAWRIPGTEEPGGLPSMGSHRVGHDWSDLAAAATVHRNSLQTWTNEQMDFFTCALDSSKNLGPRYPDLGAWRKKTPWLQLSAIPLSYLEILFVSRVIQHQSSKSNPSWKLWDPGRGSDLPKVTQANQDQNST